MATELRENGVDVILDKWDLRAGQDANVFMEKMVTDPKIRKVALICDRMYADKADARSGGVGTETQIISAEIYAKYDQSKFVAILPEKNDDGEPFLPTYYKSRIYIDLSSIDLYSRNFEQLLRWIYDKPMYVKPPIGNIPAFLADESITRLGTTPRFRRVLEAVRQDKSYSGGALHEYFDIFSRDLEKFRITRDGGEFDDNVMRNIEEFLPYRNEAVELFLVLAQYRPTQHTWATLHSFFENLIPYLYKPENVRSGTKMEFDNFRFIVHELFLYVVASLLVSKRFEGVSHLVDFEYYVEQNAKQGHKPMVSYTVFRKHVPSLEHRNKRLGLQRLSLRADLLEHRSKSSGISFQQMMQADFVLYIRDCLDSIRSQRRLNWWPETLLYASRQYGPFEIFARSQSKQYFQKLRLMLHVESKDDLLELAKAFRENTLRVPEWAFESFDPLQLMGFDDLATLP